MTNQDEAERIRRDRIERRAFEIYRARGSHHGMDQEDWWQAEREIDSVPASDDRLPDLDDDDAPDNRAEGI
jgi:hypothetical protein